MRALFAIGVVFVLTGCAYKVDLMSRDGTKTGTGVATEDSSGGGPVSLNIGPRNFTGRWAVGSGGFGGIGVTPGAANPTTLFVGGGDYAGNILLRGQEDGYIRCDFSYSSWSSSGIGVCQEKDGTLYDMQIRRGGHGG